MMVLMLPMMFKSSKNAANKGNVTFVKQEQLEERNMDNKA
jgi:hypothetical protein